MSGTGTGVYAEHKGEPKHRTQTGSCLQHKSFIVMEDLIEGCWQQGRVKVMKEGAGGSEYNCD